MTSPRSLVSVCIPAYNRGKLLRACLWSVVRQTMTDLEIILVDNNSEEDLREIVLSFNDPRIRYYRNERNIGAAANFRRAADLATGEYLKFVCSDDLLLATCLEESINEMEAYPGASALVFKHARFDAGGMIHGGRYSLPWIGLARNLSIRDNLSVYRFCNAGPTEVLFRRKAFCDLGGFNRNLEAIVDWELYVRMLQTGGGVLFYDRVLAICFDHSERESRDAVTHLRFLEDALKLSRQVPEGKITDVWNVIWWQLSQSIRDGRNVLPALKLVHDYGWLGRFCVIFPFLAIQHFWRRLVPHISMKSSKSNISVVTRDRAAEMEHLLVETWTKSQVNDTSQG